MADGSKIHLRRCCGCGTLKDKRLLIRVIRDSEGRISIDDTHKKNGRGAYICRSASCLGAARKKHSLERALKSSVDEAVYLMLQDKYISNDE